MTERYIGSGRQREGGFPVTHKQDFLAHTDGGDWRHTANHLDLSSPISGLNATTVQEALEIIQGIISSTGSGFCSIGDGYQSFGSYNVGVSTTLEECFESAFNDLRLISGGVILVMSGNYQLTTTVSIPPGITIMGEIGGTMISGVMSNAPMFTVQAAVLSRNIGGNSGSGVIPLSVGSNSEKVKFYNLMLADNLEGSSATMTSVPMISVQKSANFEAERVSFLGKINNGSVLNRLKTSQAVATTSGGITGTSIVLKECFADGIKQLLVNSSSAGNADFIAISNCKVRWFGAESSGYSNSADSAIFSTLCNTSILNSYFVGSGTHTRTVCSFNSTGGSTSNIRVIISGISGTGLSTATGNLIDNQSGTTFQGTLTGNNWASNINSPWYLVVGGADGLNPAGDIYGPNAINYIINLARQSLFEGTVIVNPGTYSVTASATSTENWGNIKIIGNKKGNVYPVFEMDISSTTTDQLGNRFLVLGNHIESINFSSIGSTFNSIRPTFSATTSSTQDVGLTLTVKDCLFKDVSCNLMPLGASQFVDHNGTSVEAVVNFENLYFTQSGNYSNNLSLCCPCPNAINFKNVYFEGFGFALSIGAGYSSDYDCVSPIITFDNVVGAFTNGTVEDAFSISGYSSLVNTITVVNTTAKMFVKNSKFYVSDTFANRTNYVGATKLSTNTYNALIFINCESLSVCNSLINAPNQVYVASSVNYAVTGLKISCTGNITLINNEFYYGACPLYLYGTYASDTIINNIIIDSNKFISTVSRSNYLIYTNLVNASSSFVDTLQLSNNIFKHGGCSAEAEVADGDVEGIGSIVNITARGFDVSAYGNNIYGELYPGVYSSKASLFINTYEANGGNTSLTTKANIYENVIFTIGGVVTSSANDSTSCCNVRSTFVKVQDNVFQFSSKNILDANFSGCLVVDGRKLNDGGIGLVSGNTFSRADILGDLEDLNQGYIKILSSTTITGSITGNVFDSPFFIGGDTNLVKDDTAVGDNWTYNNNKNQTEIINIRGNVGVFGIRSPAETNYTLVGPTASNSFIAFNSAAATEHVMFHLVNTGTETVFKWSVSLNDILPIGAYVTYIQISFDVSANLTTTSTASINVFNNGSLIGNTSGTVTTSGLSLTQAFTSNEVPANPESSCSIDINWNANSSAGRVCTLTALQITYRV